MTMGERIKNARLAKKYKQEYVAEALGVSRQAVSKWERDQTQPDTKNLIALSKLLNVSVDHLTSDVQESETTPSSKIKGLRRISFVLFLFSILFWCTGFFSGAYSTMLFVPVSQTLAVGIPFIWYGKSTAAIGIKTAQITFLILSILVRMIAWAIENDKQALV